MFHGHLDYLQKALLGGRSITKPGDHDTPNAHDRWFILFLSCVRTHINKKNYNEIAYGWGLGHIWLHTTLEGPWPHHMMLEVCWDGLWTLSFGLSQFNGHGSWLAFGPLHTRDWEPVTFITLQALSLVEKAEPVQVFYFTLPLEGSKELCECKMDVKSTWIPTWHPVDRVSWSLGLSSKSTSWR